MVKHCPPTSRWGQHLQPQGCPSRAQHSAPRSATGSKGWWRSSLQHTLGLGNVARPGTNLPANCPGHIMALLQLCWKPTRNRAACSAHRNAQHRISTAVEHCKVMITA